MVQLKYFGDSRDYFKYDLITYILKSGILKNYVFIPMLTDHRYDNEGNKLPKYIEGKSSDLLEFIDRCNSKDLAHWEVWLSPYVSTYKTIEPVNDTFFSDGNRGEYWEIYEAAASNTNSLVFVDPDTGLETGTPGYLKKAGREKYILNGELSCLFNVIDDGSVLMIYQHLPNNKHIHEASVEKKIEQARSVNKNAYVMAYREDDLVFIFMIKNKQVFKKLKSLLSQYFEKSGHKYKSIHSAYGCSKKTD